MNGQLKLLVSVLGTNLQCLMIQLLSLVNCVLKCVYEITTTGAWQNQLRKLLSTLFTWLFA